MSFPRYSRYKNSGIGWLGEIPDHWSVSQSRRLFVLRNERAKESDEQLTASQQHGVIPQKLFMEHEGRRVVEVIKGADILKHVEPNDFVISMRSFEGGIEWSQARGCISSAYVMLVPTARIHPPFFAYLFKSATYIQALQSTTNLVRDGQALRFNNFAQVDLPLVPLNEQVRVAEFLDRETAKIDALVAEQQRLIELLKEKRQAVISHAVTKGLNPDAPMKPSGIEWLGDVPAHWHVKRLKFVLDSVKAGPFGSALTKDLYTSTGYKVYGQEQVIPGDFTLGDYFISSEKYQELRQYTVTPGDILISCVGTFGKIAIVPPDVEPGIINPRLIRMRCAESINPEYLVEVLRSAATFEQLSALTRGGTMDVINISTLNEIVIVLPPLLEQERAVTFIRDQIEQFDQLTAETEQAIRLLSERRTALISAAVTGQIDVREFANKKEAA